MYPGQISDRVSKKQTLASLAVSASTIHLAKCLSGLEISLHGVQIA
jgi:hypothetical protein